MREAAGNQAVIHLGDRRQPVRIVLNVDECALKKHLSGYFITSAGDESVRLRVVRFLCAGTIPKYAAKALSLLNLSISTIIDTM